MSTYDIATRISDNQSLIGAALAKSTSSIHVLSNGATGVFSLDLAPGAPIVFRVHITQTFNTSIDNLSIQSIYAIDANMNTGTYFPLITIPQAQLVKGLEFDVVLPALPKEYFGGAFGTEYIGLLYGGLLAGVITAPTAGAISAWVPLGHTAGLPKRYAANYTGP